VSSHRLVETHAAVRAEIDSPTANPQCRRHRNSLTKWGTALGAADEHDRNYRATEAEDTEDGEEGQLVAVKAQWARNGQDEPASEANTHGPTHPALDVVANSHGPEVYPRATCPNWDLQHAEPTFSVPAGPLANARRGPGSGRGEAGFLHKVDS
jgi:hypothetical protein